MINWRSTKTTFNRAPTARLVSGSGAPIDRGMEKVERVGGVPLSEIALQDRV